MTPLRCNHKPVGCGFYSSDDESSTGRTDTDKLRIKKPFYEQYQVHRERYAVSCREAIEFKQCVYFKLRILVVSESQVCFIEAHGLAVNFITTGTAMTVGANRDEVFILMFFTRLPRNDVVNINFNVAARGNSATMPRFNQNSSSEFSRNGRSIL